MKHYLKMTMPFNNDKADTNDSSLVVQAVMKDGDAKAELLIGGDAGCSIWKTINRKTKENKNIARLMWDVFYAPHHGSYKFFTQKEHDEGREEAEDSPDPDSMEIIDRGNENSRIVCSSRPVKEGNYDDGDPPHIEAIGHYKEKVRDDNFICLMEHPDEDDPDPLVLRLTQNGLQEKAFAVAAIGIGSKTIASPKRWGK